MKRRMFFFLLLIICILGSTGCTLPQPIAALLPATPTSTSEPTPTYIVPEAPLMYPYPYPLSSLPESFSPTYEPYPQPTQLAESSELIPTATITPTFSTASESSSEGFAPAGAPNTYWMVNPASGSKLYIRLFIPKKDQGKTLPTLILVPGGTGVIDPKKAQALTEGGFLVITFDPDGRGKSEGHEDLGGFIHQEGLAALLKHVASLPGVDGNQIGLVSYSYGITMASGVLSRFSDLPVRFLIDWEGPADREDTTVGCPSKSKQPWPPCDDDEAWAEREALTFIGDLEVPYQRIQTERDHVQPDILHAIDLINAAVDGGVPWVRLNNRPENEQFDTENPPDMLSEKNDKKIEQLIIRYALELFALP